MPKVTNTVQICIDGGYDVSAIEGEDRLWVALTSRGQAGIVRFWSQRLEPGATPLPPTEVMSMVVQGLYAWNASDPAAWDELTLWPAGWDFWGIGVPAPIEHYFRSQFRADLAAARTEGSEGAVHGGRDS